MNENYERHMDSLDGNLEISKYEPLFKAIKKNIPDFELLEGERDRFIENLRNVKDVFGKEYLGMLLFGLPYNDPDSGVNYELGKINGKKLKKMIKAMGVEIEELAVAKEEAISEELIISIQDLQFLENQHGVNDYREYVREQIDEIAGTRVTTSDALSESDIFKSIDKKDHKAIIDYFKNREESIKKQLSNEYFDTALTNMASGMTLVHLNQMNDYCQVGKFNIIDFLKTVKSKKDGSLHFAGESQKVNIGNAQELLNQNDKIDEEFYKILNDEKVIKASSNGIRNEILMNPYKLSEVYKSFAEDGKQNNWDIAKRNLKKKLLDCERVKFEGLTIPEKKSLTKIGNKFNENIGDGDKKGMKQRLEANFRMIMSLKQSLEKAGMGKFIIEMLDFLLRMLGRKDGFSQFEKEMLEKRLNLDENEKSVVNSMRAAYIGAEMDDEKEFEEEKKKKKNAKAKQGDATQTTQDGKPGAKEQTEAEAEAKPEAQKVPEVVAKIDVQKREQDGISTEKILMQAGLASTEESKLLGKLNAKAFLKAMQYSNEYFNTSNLKLVKGTKYCFPAVLVKKFLPSYADSSEEDILKKKLILAEEKLLLKEFMKYGFTRISKDSRSLQRIKTGSDVAQNLFFMYFRPEMYEKDYSKGSEEKSKKKKEMKDSEIDNTAGVRQVDVEDPTEPEPESSGVPEPVAGIDSSDVDESEVPPEPEEDGFENEERPPESKSTLSKPRDDNEFVSVKINKDINEKSTDSPILQNYETMLATNDGRYFEKYSHQIIKHCNIIGIPPNIMLNLFIIEGSKGNSKASPGTTSAQGLGQMIDGTWGSCITWANRYPEYRNIQWDRDNPEHQIITAGLYLKHHYDGAANGDWKKATIYYHTGGKVDDNNVAKFLRNNPAVERRFEGSRIGKGAGDNYYAAAEKTYFSSFGIAA